jgi:diguanylate cyclase (GGDEF)-like protein/PAS domain S-box-containing protein
MKDDFIYKSIFTAMGFSFAYHKIICDGSGCPIDFEIIDANDNFKALFDLNETDLKGKRASCFMPALFTEKTDFLTGLWAITLSQGSKEFIQFSKRTNKWVKINVLSFEKLHFATLAYLIDDTQSNDVSTVKLEEIIEVEKLQEIQDAFAEAMGVGSVITRPDGSAITEPSNFAVLCNDLIRGTEKGMKQCMCSDAVIGKCNKDGPTINKCFSAGLWDAGATITAGDRHVANWLIGQVKNEQTDEEKLLAYTDELGIDREKAAAALSQVTFMPLEKLKGIANVLYICANEISERAYLNDQQAKLIDRLKHAEERIYSENEQLKVTLMSIGEAVITTDKNGRVALMNRTAEEITGYPFEQARGEQIHGVFDVINAQTGEGSEGPVEKVLQGETGGSIACNSTVLSKDGVLREVAQTVSPIIGKGGAIEGTVIVFRDITEQRLKEKEILYLSYHDMLTGLYNRRYFEKKLEEYANEKYMPLSLVMGDVNSLKLANDIFGHLEGDKILRYTSTVLKKSCRKKDIAARWGGDEFVILMPNCTEDQARETCEKIYQEFLSTDEFNIKLSISLGCSSRKDMSENPVDVLKRAEVRMYRNKAKDHESFDKEVINSIKKRLAKEGPVTEEQITRTKDFCIKTGVLMHLSGEEIKKLALLADTHDIGNIAVKGKILRKQGKFDEEEWNAVKDHPKNGYTISQAAKEYSNISELILTRHEQWDGGGYPEGRSGNETPVLSRILAVVDSYVAMTSDRPHRKAMTSEKAITELRKYAGQKYDARVVEVFIDKVLNT